MVIRPLLEADTESAIDLGARLHAESVYAFLPYSREKIRSLILRTIEDPAEYCGLVADDRGHLAGILGGQISEYYFCDELVAYDTILFVEPHYRGSTAAPRLIRAFRQWAVERGATELCLAISTGVNTSRIGEFYARMGLHSVGATYKQRLR